MSGEKWFGIVYAGANSRAVLTLEGKTGVYKVGDRLPDGETVKTIGPESVTLAEAGNLRRLNLPRYGQRGSEGPTAYAALLHGTGLSSPDSKSAAAGPNPAGTLAQSGSAGIPGQSLPPLSARTRRGVATPAAQAVRVSARATPLEQLRALRHQLIHQH